MGRPISLWFSDEEIKIIKEKSKQNKKSFGGVLKDVFFKQHEKNKN